MTTLVDRNRFDGHTLAYLPRYASQSDPIWRRSDSDVLGEFIEGLLDEAEDDAEIEYLEEALDNLVDSQMFADLDLPLFDFDEDDLMDMNEAYPDDEGDD